MSSTPTILVLGSLSMDFVTTAPRIPIPGETILTSPHSFHTGPGGKGANQAFALAKLSHRHHFTIQMIGMVGSDQMGKEIIHSLQQGGVNIDRIQTCTEFTSEGEKVPTGVATIIIESTTGQNRIIVTPGANFHLLPQHIPLPTLSNFPPPLLSPPSILVLQQESHPEIISHAITLYHNHSIPIILNPAPAFPLSTLLRQNIDYSKVSYLIPNETEAAILLGNENDDPVQITNVQEAKKAATEILSLVGIRKAVVITLGGLGAVVSYRLGGDGDGDGGVEIKEIHIPARKVPVVDTTAAGDTFVAAFALEIARERDVLQAVRVGIKASSLTVQRRGAIKSIPTLDEVEGIVDG